MTVLILQMRKLRLQRELVTISPRIRAQVCLTPEPLLERSARPGRKEAGGSGGQGWMVEGVGDNAIQVQIDSLTVSVTTDPTSLPWSGRPPTDLPALPPPAPAPSTSSATIFPHSLLCRHPGLPSLAGRLVPQGLCACFFLDLGVSAPSSPHSSFPHLIHIFAQRPILQKRPL